MKCNYLTFKDNFQKAMKTCHKKHHLKIVLFAILVNFFAGCSPVKNNTPVQFTETQAADIEFRKIIYDQKDFYSSYVKIFSFEQVVDDSLNLCLEEQENASDILNSGMELDSCYIRKALMNIKKAQNELKEYSTVLSICQRSSDPAIREIAKANLDNVLTKQKLLKALYGFFSAPKEYHVSDSKMNMISEYRNVDYWQDWQNKVFGLKGFEKKLFGTLIPRIDNELKEIIQKVSTLQSTLIEVSFNLETQLDSGSHIKNALNEQIEQNEKIFLEFKNSSNTDVSDIAEKSLEITKMFQELQNPSTETIHVKHASEDSRAVKKRAFQQSREASLNLLKSVENAVKNSFKSEIAYDIKNKITADIFHQEDALDESFDRCCSVFYSFSDGQIFDPDYRFHVFKEIKKTQSQLDKYAYSIARYIKMEDPEIRDITEGYLRCIESIRGALHEIYKICSSPNALREYSTESNKLNEYICLYWKEWHQLLPRLFKVGVENINSLLSKCDNIEFKKIMSAVTTYGPSICESNTYCIGQLLDMHLENKLLDPDFKKNYMQSVQQSQEQVGMFLYALSEFKDSSNANTQKIAVASINSLQDSQQFFNYLAYSLSKDQFNRYDMFEKLQMLLNTTKRNDVIAVLSQAMDAEFKVCLGNMNAPKITDTSQNLAGAL